ncbi:hypothetical protein A4H97_30520 [Niastella yeongjuensis]|uniref:Lipoprotein n=1 Tax=Niastella yeongjuensis TaxID=354355 RepID=A0A1V9ENZ1_9BACT|nr:hypothetical protein [Niastella yeongjuensis]OQP47847.1 hypothetical protein A4H97_30520 [Niastella yeongjuensis]SEP48307.1 hypothetical protein SAMN05660816_06741 [Niastella yeongjuensis]
MKLFFYLIFLTCIGISCKTKSSDKIEYFKTLVTDTMKLMPYNEIDISKVRTKEFNLPEIYKGVDSFELRIWISSMTIPDFATILRYSDSQWVAHKYTYFENGNILDSLIIKRINLPDSIGNLVSYLSDSAVLMLPSQHKIPGFVDNVADGQTCTIEISTKTFYKALHYHCPEHFSDSYNKKFMEIVMFLNTCLHFYYPLCLPTT